MIYRVIIYNVILAMAIASCNRDEKIVEAARRELAEKAPKNIYLDKETLILEPILGIESLVHEQANKNILIDDWITDYGEPSERYTSGDLEYLRYTHPYPYRMTKKKLVIGIEAIFDKGKGIECNFVYAVF